MLILIRDIVLLVSVEKKVKKVLQLMKLKYENRNKIKRSRNTENKKIA